MTRGHNHDRPEAIRNRLESWRECLRIGKPGWLAELAPGAIAQLEADLAKAERIFAIPRKENDRWHCLI